MYSFVMFKSADTRGKLTNYVYGQPMTGSSHVFNVSEWEGKSAL